jgi:hypothetical protein
MKNKIITAFLGLSIFSAYAEKIIVPLSNTMGRSCFGHLYATDAIVDFYTEYFDCPKMHYYKATQEVIAFNIGNKIIQNEIVNYDTRTFFLKKSTKTCPYSVIMILKKVSPKDYYPYEVIAYPSIKAYMDRAEIPNISKDNENTYLNCAGYPIESTKKELGLVKPYSKRAKPTPRPKPVQPHGGQLDPL